MQTPASTIVQTGDLGGRKVQMSIDTNALAHIMSVLTDLYSDPQNAVIREYSTNARDAHIEAGCPDVPIEVSTPSAFSPYFKIVDHGVGLSVDDIIAIYSKYGASTKRGTNEQTGMLGLGCKSALTLVPQFSLTSIRDGVKIFVSISRAADGTGQMEIVDTKATTESNGVEISIPMQRSSYFTDKVKNFFRFWEPGTVLVDGHEPAGLNGQKVGTKFIVDRSLEKDYIVMGGVPYPVQEKLYDSNNYRAIGVVAFVEIGEINFTPSREELSLTPTTKATIRSLKEEFIKDLAVSINKDIAESKTFPEAWKKAYEWRQTFNGLKDLTYKGQNIPNEIELAPGKACYAGAGRTYFSWVGGFNYRSRNTYLYVVNFGNAEFKASPIQRRKMAAYCSQNNVNVSQVFMTTAATAFARPELAKWVDDINIADWSLIDAIKLPKVVRATGAVRTDPYDVYRDGKLQQVSVLDVTKPIVYFTPADLKYPSWLPRMFPDAQVVSLTRNRWEKFCRDWPSARGYWEYIAAEQEKVIKQLTREDIIRMKNGNHVDLDHTKINDPDLAFFVRVVNDKTFKYSAAADRLRELTHQQGPKPLVPAGENPLTNYPLAGSMYRIDDEHKYWYFNTFYNTKLKEKK